MQRFFVEPHQIDRDRHEIRITGNDVNHIVNVLRMKKGEELWISDKEKEYHCVIENAGEDEVLLHILYVQESCGAWGIFRSSGFNQTMCGKTG